MARKAKAKEEEAEAPAPAPAPAEDTVPDWSVIAGLKRTALDEKVSEFLSLKAEIEEREARMAELKEEGVKLLIKADVKTVRVPDLTVEWTNLAGETVTKVDVVSKVTRMDGSSSRLDKAKLARLHGPKVLGWLDECTVKTAYTTMLVTVKKEKKDEEEEG